MGIDMTPIPLSVAKESALFGTIPSFYQERMLVIYNKNCLGFALFSTT